jgi:hypothetical protein
LGGGHDTGFGVFSPAGPLSGKHPGTKGAEVASKRPSARRDAQARKRKPHGLAPIALPVLLLTQPSFAIVQAPIGAKDSATLEALPTEHAPTEEVVVSGEQPGPGLWKVTHRTHVL